MPDVLLPAEEGRQRKQSVYLVINDYYLAVDQLSTMLYS